MPTDPLVSVICLCHNQAVFVKSAIESVWMQSYPHIELIVVDDGSSDGSKETIRETLKGREISFIDLPISLGNCKAFNIGFNTSKGIYIIDLAADDQLLAVRVAEGVADFQKHESPIGVHFSDAFIADENMGILRTHFTRDREGQLSEKVPSGDVFIPVISRYFICPPTMMIHRAILEKLGGYDESLLYEDFDFWIRSARDFPYLFNKAPLVTKRTLQNSHSRSQFKLRNRHQHSTLAVCKKAFQLCKAVDEFAALRNRSIYEIYRCMRTLNLEVGWQFLKLAWDCQRRLSSFSSMER